MFWKEHGIEKKDLLTPASILIGAILVSVSIFASSGGALGSGTKPIATAGGIENQTIATGPVAIAERPNIPSMGSGKVEVVEFSDFQCPFCQRFYNESYKEIKTKYIDTGKITFSYRHYPLPFHADAQKAAEASECANSQGKFFPYHDLLFTKLQPDGTGLSISNLKQYAKDAGLNTSRFNSCLDSGEMAEVVKKDIEEAQKAGVDGTPTLFINGEKIVGAQPFPVFQAAIEKALQ